MKLFFILTFILLFPGSSFAKKICLTGTTVKLFPKYGEAFYNGAILGAKNTDFTIEKHYYDRNPEAPIIAYKKMVESGCSIAIGFSTGNDLAAINDISKKYKMPVISIYGDNSKVIENNRFITTIQPPVEYLLGDLLKIMMKKLTKVKKTVVITAVDRHSMLAYKKEYEEVFKRNTVEFESINILERKQDLSKVTSYLKKIKTKVNVILLTRSSLGAKIIDLFSKEKVDINLILGTKYMGSSALPAFYNYLNDKTVTAFFSRHNCLCDKDKAYISFMLKYKRAFKEKPMVISGSVFDVVRYIVKSNTKKGEALIDKLGRTTMKGITGIEFETEFNKKFTKRFIIKVDKNGYNSI